MTDTDGNIVQSIAYDPFGMTVYSAGTKEPAHQFTGQEFDGGTGLYYYNARYYDPVLGRFIQADTVLDGLNRYAYCGNSPVMYTDPSGHWSIGLGLVFGWTQSHGWHVGLGAAFDFTDEIGLGVNASGVYNYGDGSITGTLSAGFNFGIGDIGGGVTVNSNSGITANLYGSFSPGAGAGFNTSHSWGWDGSYFGSIELKIMLGVPSFYTGAGLSIGSGGSSTFGEFDILGNTAQYGFGSGNWNFNVLGARFGYSGGNWSLSGYSGEAIGFSYGGYKNKTGWNLTSQSLDRVGKIWALPDTIYGLGIACSYFIDKEHTFKDINIKYNSINIQFSGGPGRATTYGNILVYQGGFTPEGTGSRYDSTGVSKPVGLHERAHTYQWQLFGIFFPLIYYPTGGANAPKHSFLEQAADNYASRGGYGNWLW